MLYARIDPVEMTVMSGPQKLPVMWYGYVLEDMTEAERLAIGWYPTNVAQGQGFDPSVSPIIEADRVKYEVPPLDEQVLIQALAQIDSFAGDARERYVSPGSLITEEYHRARIEAQAFKDASYSGPVPDAVSDWAVASGMTDEAAANNILSEGEQLYTVLDRIRGERLNAKKSATDFHTANDLTGLLSFVANAKTAFTTNFPGI